MFGVAFAIALLFGAKPSSICSGSLAIRSCRSFEEMLLAKDADVTGLSRPDGTAFVCFDPKEDKFAIVDYTQPDLKDFVKDDQGNPAAAGLVDYTTYTGGTSDSSYHIWTGNWTAYKIVGVGPVFIASSNDDPYSVAMIKPSEITLGYSYKNVNGETMSVSLVIRRSTRRFHQTISATATGDPFRLETDGHCIVRGKR